MAGAGCSVCACTGRAWPGLASQARLGKVWTGQDRHGRQDWLAQARQRLERKGADRIGFAGTVFILTQTRRFSDGNEDEDDESDC